MLFKTKGNETKKQKDGEKALQKALIGSDKEKKIDITLDFSYNTHMYLYKIGMRLYHE